MADTSTTHLELIKQDPNAAPDVAKTNTNLDTLDSEIWARGKAFNGESVGVDGEFHINSIPMADNLKTSAAQTTDEEYILRTTGGSASVESGSAWLSIVHGNSRHDDYTPEELDWELLPVERDNPITTSFDRSTFIGKQTSSRDFDLTFSTSWSEDPSLYGFTISGTPVAGDRISIHYVKEVPGTIVNTTPATFVSTGWNLYNHTNGYARVVKYSNDLFYRITGSYTSLSFAYTLDTPSSSRISITPASNGSFNPFDRRSGITDPVGTTGYLFVTGGNTTDTAIWATWSDWVNGYNWNSSTSTQGAFETYTESVVNLQTAMSENFPYGLLKAGTARDEINFTTGYAYRYVQRYIKSDSVINDAISHGLQYEYDANYVYVELSSPVVISNFTVTNGYAANDHGVEFFTGTEVEVVAENTYGINLKNKLERDTLTISEHLANNLTTDEPGLKALDAFMGAALKGTYTVHYDTNTRKEYTWKFQNGLLVTVIIKKIGVTITGSSGGIYWGTVDAQDFPVQYTTTPFVVASTYKADTNAWAWGASAPSAKKTGSTYIGRGSTVTTETDLWIRWLAVGYKA